MDIILGTIAQEEEEKMQEDFDNENSDEILLDEMLLNPTNNKVLEEILLKDSSEEDDDQNSREFNNDKDNGTPSECTENDTPKESSTDDCINIFSEENNEDTGNDDASCQGAPVSNEGNNNSKERDDDKWQVNKKTGLSMPWFGVLSDEEEGESKRKRKKTSRYGLATPAPSASFKSATRPSRTDRLPKPTKKKRVVSNQISRGLQIRKKFGAEFYSGIIVDGPHIIENEQCWQIRYEDGDEEHLNEDEIISLAIAAVVRSSQADENESEKEVDEDDGLSSVVAVVQNTRKTERASEEVSEEESNEEDSSDETDHEQKQAPRCKASQRKKGPSNIVTPTKPAATSATRRDHDKKSTPSAAEVKRKLLEFPGVGEDEIDEVLKAPTSENIGLNTAMDSIRRAREKKLASKQWKEQKTFKPHVGMRVRKSAGGVSYHGIVTKEAEEYQIDDTVKRMWEVTYDDGTIDDMDWYELQQCKASRPTTPNPLRGRQLVALELFSGCGIVTQEFAERKWLVRSVDNSETSHATDKVDIMDIAIPEAVALQLPGDIATDKDLYDFFGGCIPDFIWASLPCFTYSMLAGGTHRHVRNGEFEKTPQAHEQNALFVQMVKIILWAKRKRPHLIVVIENPRGYLTKMPMMKEFKETMGLHRALVHYCAFGRQDLKPTHLWTNDMELYGRLSLWTCREDECPFKVDDTHPGGCRDDKDYNPAAIPQVLAEEVADYVNSRFIIDRIKAKKYAD